MDFFYFILLFFSLSPHQNKCSSGNGNRTKRQLLCQKSGVEAATVTALQHIPHANYCNAGQSDDRY